MTPVIGTLSATLLACLLPYSYVYLTVLTGDLHRDSGHAALWCFLHGLSLHNGEQQWQRYHLMILFFGIICQLNFFLNICDALHIHILHFPWLPVACPLTVLCQTTPPSLWEIACLVWVAATWSLTLPVLTLTPNLPGGQLSGLFSLCWHVFKFLSPHCLLKQCFPLSPYL